MCLTSSPVESFQGEHCSFLCDSEHFELKGNPPHKTFYLINSAASEGCGWLGRKKLRDDSEKNMCLDRYMGVRRERPRGRELRGMRPSG